MCLTIRTAVGILDDLQPRVYAVLAGDRRVQSIGLVARRPDVMFARHLQLGTSPAGQPNP